MVDTFAIIAAGGTSSRFESGTPKPFILLDGHPLILYSIESFLSYDIPIHLVIPKSYEADWATIAAQYDLNALPYSFGQPTRYQSIKTALHHVPPCHNVLIHDAARPFFDSQLVASILDQLDSFTACIPLSPVVDTLKEHSKGVVHRTIDRNIVGKTQTPMGFQRTVLDDLMAENDDEHITDESQLFERAGHPISVVLSSDSNLKLTYPNDMAFADYFVRHHHPRGSLTC